MQGITIYPYHTGLLPIVRNMEKMQEQYKVEQLVSLPGSGLTGKDAGHVCNQFPLNITVKDSLGVSEEWSVLMLDGEKITDPELTEKIVEQAYREEKKIITFERYKQNIPEWRKELYEKFSVTEYPMTGSVKEIEEISHIHEISVPVVLVGGLVEEADVMETVCVLTRLLKKRGLRIETFTTESFGRLFGFHDISTFFENNDPLGTTVENINKFIYSVQEKTYPDLIVMMAPDSMIQYNSIVPNGYGIKTYMLCQAVCPDYCFCCVPEDLGVPEMLNALSEDFKGRYGVEITGAHISNLIIDAMQIIQDRVLSFSYVDMDTANLELEKYPSQRKIPVFNAICREDLLEEILDNLLEG